MKKISLKDIAAVVGVSPSTVSIVLNGKGKEMRISEKLEKRIKEYAEKSGYQPNKIAVSLRTGSSKILGLIVEDISNNFFATLAKIIEVEAEKFGYNVVFCSTENDTKKGKQLIKVLSQQQVDGFLITPTEGMCDDIRSLHEQRHPVVLMDRHFPELNIPCVLADNYHGVRDGMDHLIDNGYKNIGFVTVDMDLVQMKRREAAFFDSVNGSGSGRTNDQILRLPVNTSQADSVELITLFLKQNPVLDAVFFATNYLGIAGLESIRNLKLVIPGDLGIVCFDDHDIFRLYTPGITTIKQPTDEIGMNAVRLLIDSITKTDGSHTDKVLEYQATLMVRGSSSKIESLLC
ncbi:LacI family DNA-binding transcriptional regulator [Flavitalea sp.]|nr:LacI family DNA-binding transcriptional regulator [Flavitalea sp.]